MRTGVNFTTVEVSAASAANAALRCAVGLDDGRRGVGDRFGASSVRHPTLPTDWVPSALLYLEVGVCPRPLPTVIYIHTYIYHRQDCPSIYAIYAIYIYIYIYVPTWLDHTYICIIYMYIYVCSLHTIHTHKRS